MKKQNFLPFVDFLLSFQQKMVDTLQTYEPCCFFQKDHWSYEKGGGGGITYFLEDGDFIEQSGVNFSHIKGAHLPTYANPKYKKLENCLFEVAGLSSITHPKNPFAPTSHLNVRCFIATLDDEIQYWWFGGGFDLTPYYGFEEDCKLWHLAAKSACDSLDNACYYLFKKACDEYFYLPHRKEARGIGGIFYDDLNNFPFQQCFSFSQKVCWAYLDSFKTILNKRLSTPYHKKQRDFQCYRRGRYVEFNLLHDRGTHFGLAAKGRTESILLSLPPRVRWRYNWQPDPKKDAQEFALYDQFLPPKDWLNSI